MVTSANFLGDYEPQGAILIQAAKTAAAITKGDVCDSTGGQWRTAPAGTGAGPYAVCTKSAAASDSTVQLLLRGLVYVTADSSITANGMLIISPSTAGQVVSTATAVITTYVGKYLYHENEGDGSTVPTSAVDGDVIKIDFRGVL